MQLIRPDRCNVNGRYRIANGAPVLEEPLSAAQLQALERTQGVPDRAAITQLAVPAQRRFQGWRVP